MTISLVARGALALAHAPPPWAVEQNYARLSAAVPPWSPFEGRSASLSLTSCGSSGNLRARGYTVLQPRVAA